jgi:hypothetical protein
MYDQQQPPYNPNGPPPMWVPPPPPPPRRYSVGRLVTLAIVAAVVFAGCGGLGGALTGSIRNDGLTSVPDAPAHIGPRDGRALFKGIVPPPAGAHEYTIDGSTEGVLDIGQYSTENTDGDPTDYRRGLVSRGFRIAAERAWLETDGVQYDVQLLQFATDDGAADEVSDQQAYYAKDAATDATFAIPGATTGEGYHDQDFDKYGLRHSILIARAGDLVVVMLVYTPGRLDRVAEVARFQAQITALSKL